MLPKSSSNRVHLLGWLLSPFAGTGARVAGRLAPCEFKRFQLLKSDLALALTWWSITFPSSKQTVVGNTTMNLQKFDDGWKVIAAHSSTAEM